MNNISSRDKKLLIVLAFLLTGFVLYMTVYSPQMDSISELSKQLTALKEQQQATKTNEETIRTTKDQIEKVTDTIDTKADRFLPRYSADRTINYLYSLAAASGITITGITADPSEVVDLKITSSSKAASPSYSLRTIVGKLEALAGSTSSSGLVSSSQAADKTPSNIEVTKMSLVLNEASYASLIAWMKNVEQQDKSIRFTSVLIEGKGAKVNAKIGMSIYSIDKIPGSADPQLVFTPVSPSGKPNPFE